MNNIIKGYELVKKSNGKSVENVINNNNNANNNKSKNKINQKKENYIPDKFIFCSSVRNFNNYCCFNMKHQRERENCDTNEKKGNKSISKRCCDNNDKNKKEIHVKSTHRSYLNMYEKDRLLRMKKKKLKNEKNIKPNEIITIYKNNGKRPEQEYKRVLFKID